jgi:hypothetical protein
MLSSFLSACVLATALCAPAQKPKEIPAREPGPDPPAHQVFQAQSKAGLRYTWVAPQDYDGQRACDLSVFLHGTLDPVVPYVQSEAAREARVDAKLPLVHLRRLEGYNH